MASWRNLIILKAWTLIKETESPSSIIHTLHTHVLFWLFYSHHWHSSREGTSAPQQGTQLCCQSQSLSQCCWVKSHQAEAGLWWEQKGQENNSPFWLAGDVTVQRLITKLLPTSCTKTHKGSEMPWGVSYVLHKMQGRFMHTFKNNPWKNSVVRLAWDYV